MTSPQGKAKILIVDDEPANLVLLEDILAAEHYHVIAAQNGIDALSQVVREMPDLILLDVMIPKVDGFEVCRRLKNDETTRWIPIIIITALGNRRDRIKGMDAGADDFVTKPFNDEELLARIRNLLHTKTLNDKLVHSYNHIDQMSRYVSQILTPYHPFQIQVESLSETLIKHVLKSHETIANGPYCVWISFKRKKKVQQDGFLFSRNGNEDFVKEQLALDLFPHLQAHFEQSKNDILVCSWQQKTSAPGNCTKIIPEKFRERIGEIHNYVVYLSDSLIVIALNYIKEVTDHEVTIFRNAILNVRFLNIISKHIDESETAFQYTIGALARAAEVNDEDTGNHIKRVGKYSTLVAESMGCPQSFVREIGYSAKMHDVGKIHVHPDILRKEGKLTPEEWEEMKKHTLYGPKIIGNSPKLTTARDIALHHHEKWDGSGYPRGLRKEEISLAGRIVTIADIYDALRTRRSYKKAFSHEDSCRIMLEGDDRVNPAHFDPNVLHLFKKHTGIFEEIYETLKDVP